MSTRRIDISLLEDSLKGLILNALTLDNAYTKSETDARIQAILGTAPANLDTLQELANALNNDSNFASEIVTLMNNKVDIILGKQLSTEDYTALDKAKLINIQANANNYTHPVNHSPSIITQDSSNRFVTDSEKTLWQSAVTHISDLIGHITGAERTLWNGKANVNSIPTDTSQLIKTDVYTKIEVDNSLATKSDTTHNHDGRYAIKNTEVTIANQGTLITGLRTDVSSIQSNIANGDVHSNFTVINSLTQLMLDGWNSAVTHISDLVKHITSAERISWNAKSNFSGSYVDLTSKPIIPTVVSALTNDSMYQTATQVDTSISSKADKSYVDTQNATKVSTTTFTGHTGSTSIHVLQTDKDTWNAHAKITQGTVQPTSGWYFKEI
jgi:hypothetical protein